MTTPKRYAHWTYNGRKHRALLPEGMTAERFHEMGGIASMAAVGAKVDDIPSDGITAEQLRQIGSFLWQRTTLDIVCPDYDEMGRERRKLVAEEIHRLIQSKPRSPTVEEIAAILERFT